VRERIFLLFILETKSRPPFFVDFAAYCSLPEGEADEWTGSSESAVIII
jgi:hypothetical protein